LRKTHLFSLFLFFLLFRPLASLKCSEKSSLIADQLTVDPPLPWEAVCTDCVPPEPCYPEPLITLWNSEVLETEITVHLMDPIYCDGILSTESGGVLSGPDIRIQAKKIEYLRQKDCDPPQIRVTCEGQLLIDYGEWTLTGSAFSYDFLTHSGKLIQGKVASPPWYIGGEEILLTPEGEIHVTNGYITTSEGGEDDILITSPSVTLTPDAVLTARSIQLRIKNIPVFWIPKIHLDLKETYESPFGVQFGWGGFLGSHLGIRYQFLKWGHFRGYARLDGYLGRGFAGGIETEYNPPCDCIEFYTRNYYAHDLSIYDPKKRDRYRFQGTYYDRIFDQTTSVELIYDIVSDAQMAADYQTDDFELNTAQRTQLDIRKEDPNWIAELFTRVRVNSFQSVNQELPTLFWTWHPFELWQTGIIAESFFKASYLNFVYSDELTPEPPDFQSGRFEIHPRIYRPFHWGALTVTPMVSLIGIAYSDNPSHEAVGQAAADFCLQTETALYSLYGSLKHVIEPYLHYHHITAPRSGVDHHYVFTIQDAYAHLNLLRLGVRNSLYFRDGLCVSQPLWLDLWTNAFFDTSTISTLIPKVYLTAEWSPYPRLFIGIDTAWNNEHHQVDFYNHRLDWTFNENLATSLEYRQRGRYAWRKADFYNFILESVRPEEEYPSGKDILPNKPQLESYPKMETWLGSN
jgi:hypothetical protein